MIFSIDAKDAKGSNDQTSYQVKLFSFQIFFKIFTEQMSQKTETRNINTNLNTQYYVNITMN